MKKLLVLAAIGVALKYFLDSAEGKKLQKQVTDWLEDAQDAFGDTLKTATSKVEDSAKMIDKSIRNTN